LAAPAPTRLALLTAADGPPPGASPAALATALGLQRAVGNLAVRRALQDAALQRDHHMNRPQRNSVKLYNIQDVVMDEQDVEPDPEDYDYDDLAEGWEFPDDHTYGEPREHFPYTRPGFTKEVKKAILKRDLGKPCALCGKKLTAGQAYTTKKGKSKIDNLDIDHYSPDWIVRLGKIKDYYRLRAGTNPQTIRGSVTEAYNDYSGSAAIPGASGYLRLTHAPCNRSRPKSYG
jgi:hypothetical protein